MYQVLLVDDELPALRFLETIITKYAPAFTVISQQHDGASALAWLKEHPSDADVLITDIRMPDMDGILLAKSARLLRPDLHIVIVSGYSEFEYAHGAIEASVDDYLLKPVSVSHMKELLGKIKEQLDVSRLARLSDDLTALIKGEEIDQRLMDRVFGDSDYHFALMRYGNVLYPQHPLLEVSLLCTLSFEELLRKGGCGAVPDLGSESDVRLLTPIEPKQLYVLSGRDPRELLLFARTVGSSTEFQEAVRQMASASEFQMSTVIFSRCGVRFEKVGVFYEQASKLLRHTAVLGQYREAILLDDASSAPASASISPTILRRLELCVSENNQKDIQNIFQSLGSEWDAQGVTQRQAYVMLQQLLHLVEAVRQDHWKDTAQIITEADQLTNTAASYSELLESLFQLLFDPEQTGRKQNTPEDMYHYAIQTIHRKFNQPISIQTVCSEIGISQTYLSRLFRKYGDTSFNAYLVQCRIDNAKKMLEEQPDVPLHQIAVCVGYDDYAYFSKVFRQVVGISPSKYQDALKN